LFSGAITLTSSTVVKAKAFRSGYNPSTEASASFAKTESSVPPTGNVYYVATNGSDSNPGTTTQPFRTLKKGVSVLTAGDTLYVKDGTYFGSGQLMGIPSGTSWNKPVTIAAYPGHRPVIVAEPGWEAVLYFIGNHHTYQRY
jgi:hypothetical protein